MEFALLRARCATIASFSAAPPASALAVAPRVQIDVPAGRPNARITVAENPVRAAQLVRTVLVSHYAAVFAPVMSKAEGPEAKIVLVVAGNDARKAVAGDEAFEYPAFFCAVVALEDAALYFNQEKKSSSVEGEGLKAKPSRGHHCVVIIAAAALKQSDDVHRFIGTLPAETAVVLFNCFTERGFSQRPAASILVPGFTSAYCARMVAGGSGVVLRDGMNAQWHIFVEVASFEYEWVACMPHDWVPSEEAWREAVHPRKKVFFSGFFREAQHGHSGG